MEYSKYRNCRFAGDVLVEWTKQASTPPVRTRSWVTSLSGTSSCCWHDRSILCDGSKNSATRQLVTKLGSRHGLLPVDSIIHSYETQKINNSYSFSCVHSKMGFIVLYKKKLCYLLYCQYLGIFRIFVLNLLSFQWHVHSIRITILL